MDYYPFELTLPTAPAIVHPLFQHHSSMRERRAGDLLIQAGETAPPIHFIHSGHCAYIHTNPQGISRICGILPPGGFCGFPPGFSRSSAPISVFCLDPVKAHTTPYTFFLKKIKADMRTYVDILEYVLIATNSLYSNILHQLNMNLPQRLAVFLRGCSRCMNARPDASGRVFLPLKLSHERLGMLTSATRVTTTLLLSHMTRLGVLEQGKEGFRFKPELIDPEFIRTELARKEWTRIRQRRSCPWREPPQE
ncbi:MAG: Crp/Fnr family transcriptional regulator [Deltaproteobacteria bacterium]|jgi:CRP-like cAMP-binding protein|nr:Crp/Fnr family transcriptional regulator [Deltaproteobacteria bacterium]